MSLFDPLPSNGQLVFLIQLNRERCGKDGSSDHTAAVLVFHVLSSSAPPVFSVTSSEAYCHILPFSPIPRYNQSVLLLEFRLFLLSELGVSVSPPFLSVFIGFYWARVCH